MKGKLKLITLFPNGDVKEQELSKAPDLAMLKEAIGGGYVEAVPHWNKYGRSECAVFVDEDGKRKQLPYNMRATMMWDSFLRKTFHCGCAPDYLVGQVAIVTGDAKLMRDL